MTTQEQKFVDTLLKLVQDLKTENAKFREADKKLYPVTMEEDILKTAQASIGNAITAVFTGYNNPLSKLIISVVDENSKELRSLISDSFVNVIRTENFKESIVNAFSHKVARTIISNNEGLFDKVSNELKNDATFKAKMAIAVSNVVNECLLERER